MKKTSVELAKEKAIDVMKHVYDPLHDHNHVLAVERDAKKVAKLLGVTEKINRDALELACLWHDSSRKIIRQNILLQPFVDGYFSSRIAKKELTNLGVDKKTIDMTIKIIRKNETFLGIFPRKHFLESSILADADALQSFSTERFEHFVKYTEEGLFSKKLFSMYLLGSLFLLERNMIVFNHSESILLMHQTFIPELKSFFETEFTRIKNLTIWPIQKLVYLKIVRDFPRSIAVSYRPYFNSQKS